MRLIDADKLKEEVVKLCERINANNGITVPTLAFTRIIDNAPTVENITVFCENADEKTTEELKTELERVNDEFMKDYKRVKHTSLGDVGKVCDVCAFRNKKFERACEECRNHDTFIFDGYVKKVDGEK